MAESLGQPQPTGVEWVMAAAAEVLRPLLCITVLQPIVFGGRSNPATEPDRRRICLIFICPQLGREGPALRQTLAAIKQGLEQEQVPWSILQCPPDLDRPLDFDQCQHLRNLVIRKAGLRHCQLHLRVVFRLIERHSIRLMAVGVASMSPMGEYLRPLSLLPWPQPPKT